MEVQVVDLIEALKSEIYNWMWPDLIEGVWATETEQVK